MIATLARETAVNVVNFIVVGEIRSGSAIVQNTIDALPGAVCHANLFHQSQNVRRACHESYFGPSKDPVKQPEWYEPEITNPYQYINHRVLDNALQNEQAVGLRMTYDMVRRHEMHDLMADRCAEGDFCVIHVVRNPVACFVSLKQAEQANLWARGLNDPPSPFIPSAVGLNAEELTEFVRNWVSVRGKITRACQAPDAYLEINYRDLFMNFQSVMNSVVDFIELPEPIAPLVPQTRRLRNRAMRDRISSLTLLKLDLPADVRAFVDAKDLY